VDNAAAAKAARDALYVIRKSPRHKAAARKIADKHGSRKTGMPMTGLGPHTRPKRAKPKPANAAQISMDFG
jgi:deoxyribodipyrimidine photo-lyase